MAQYIDKAAVIAEIERIKNEECPIDSYEGRCKLLWFEQFLSYINTLEVKEVDLEKEIEKYLLTNATFLIGGDSKLVVHHIAKYFFELGLKAQKGGEG